VEEQLSRYWAAAAIPVKHLDPELALICDKKSDFWINQDNWPPERIERNKIGLDMVRTQYRQMLVPKFRVPRKPNA
ncbi:hypothetical protein, partial [Halorubrum sp. SD626R]|uniref:hypothetical protein n=1 Tax=Halorubrum sp. SD626R TaxID=1419722 RepID=UPI001A7E7164